MAKAAKVLHPPPPLKLEKLTLKPGAAAFFAGQVSGQTVPTNFSGAVRDKARAAALNAGVAAALRLEQNNIPSYATAVPFKRLPKIPSQYTQPPDGAPPLTNHAWMRPQEQRVYTFAELLGRRTQYVSRSIDLLGNHAHIENVAGMRAFKLPAPPSSYTYDMSKTARLSGYEFPTRTDAFFQNYAVRSFNSGRGSHVGIRVAPTYDSSKFTLMDEAVLRRPGVLLPSLDLQPNPKPNRFQDARAVFMRDMEDGVLKWRNAFREHLGARELRSFLGTEQASKIPYISERNYAVNFYGYIAKYGIWPPLRTPRDPVIVPDHVFNPDPKKYYPEGFIGPDEQIKLVKQHVQRVQNTAHALRAEMTTEFNDTLPADRALLRAYQARLNYERMPWYQKAGARLSTSAGSLALGSLGLGLSAYDIHTSIDQARAEGAKSSADIVKNHGYQDAVVNRLWCGVAGAYAGGQLGAATGPWTALAGGALGGAIGGLGGQAALDGLRGVYDMLPKDDGLVATHQPGGGVVYQPRAEPVK